MEPILGLVPDRRLGAVNHAVDHLLAPMRGQAVEEQAVGRCHAHQLFGYLIRCQRCELGLGMLLAHRDPRVGDHDIGARGGDCRIARQDERMIPCPSVRRRDHRRIRIIAFGASGADVEAE